MKSYKLKNQEDPMKLVFVPVLISFIMATNKDPNGNDPVKNGSLPKKEQEAVAPGKVDSPNGVNDLKKTLPTKEEEEEEKYTCNPRGDC
jgi:hypothetical protein